MTKLRYKWFLLIVRLMSFAFKQSLILTFFNLLRILRRSKEPNNQGIIVQFKRISKKSKNYFFLSQTYTRTYTHTRTHTYTHTHTHTHTYTHTHTHTHTHTQIDRLYLKFFWTRRASVQKGSTLHLKINVPQVRINKITNIVTYYLSALGLHQKMHLLIFLETPLGFHLSINFISSQTCIFHHGCEKIQILGDQISEKWICKSKNWK